MTKALSVKGDPAIVELSAHALGCEGYEVSTRTTGGVALQQVGGCDIVILDLGLPDMNGLDVARTICAQGITTPTLIPTVHTGEIDMVVGLDSGTDDYVIRSFRLGELLARVRVLLQYAGGEVTEDEIIEYQDVRVEVAVYRVFQGERELQLTAEEFDSLRVLIRDTGLAVSREQVMCEVWGSDPSSSTKVLDMYVLWLWRKLGDDVNSPRCITTVRGMGFRFGNI